MWVCHFGHANISRIFGMTSWAILAASLGHFGRMLWDHFGLADGKCLEGTLCDTLAGSLETL